MLLVWPDTTEIGRELLRALSGERVVGAGCYSENMLPDVSRPECLRHLNYFVGRHKVEWIFPGHDSVLEFCAENSVANVIGVNDRTLVCRSKRWTYRLLDGVVQVPEVYSEPRYPMFVKPDTGQGSKGCMKVPDERYLEAALGNASRFGEPLMLQLLTGHEVTVDCFEDLWSLPRMRDSVANGISVKTHVLEDREYYHDIAKRIWRVLKLPGAWFFQLKFHEGSHYLLEVSPRIAGGSGLARARGVNLPMLSLKRARGERVEFDERETPKAMKRVLENLYS